MTRNVRVVVVLMVIATMGGSRSVWAQGNGLPGQVAALQAQLATLSAQVTALESAAGAANVWQNTSVSTDVPYNDTQPINTWTLATVATLSLPAGSYVLQAKSTVQAPALPASLYYCALVRSGSSTVVDASFDYTNSQGTPTIIKMLAVVTLPGTETVSFQCGASGPPSTPSPANAFLSTLVAIQANVQ